MFENWTLRRKILVLGVAQLILVTGVLFYLNHRHTRSLVEDEYVARAQSIAMNAESVREEMGRKWALGLFDQQRLTDWAKQGQMEKVLAAVPIVTAWKAAQAKAKDGGYEFRVPKSQPRNPKNEPDTVEKRALAALAGGTSNEYHEIDPEKNAIRYFRPIRLTQECLACHGSPSRSEALWGNRDGKDCTGAAMEDWHVGEVHGAFEVVQSLDGADARMAQAFRLGVMVVGGLVCLAGLAMFGLVNRSITSPLKATVEAFGKIAKGDLAHRLSVDSHDEIGELRRSANTMTERLRDMILGISSCSRDLGRASGELSNTATQLAQGAEQTTRQSSTVAAAAEQMSVSMGGMAQSSEQMSQNVNLVATSVEEMTAAIGEVARSAEQAANVADDAAQLAQSTNHEISQLGTTANEVGQVIEVIQDIAEQTKLLALNATIEAARAGEAGKGFAVVATEVKELARPTAEATDDIRRRVEGIQSSAGQAVDAITHIVEVVGRVNGASRTIASAVEEQSITTKEIARNLAQTANGARTVSEGVSQTAAATREVSENIARVDQNARHTAGDASRTHDAGALLLELSGRLETMVSQFTVSEI
jgi:methyl-accepting chemotaxis protein